MSELLARIRGGVHSAVRHDSAAGHVTGAARYLDDMPNVSGTLEAALVLSPHAHARVLNIDASAARAAPGVVAVITAFEAMSNPATRQAGPLREAARAVICCHATKTRLHRLR